MKTKQDQIFWVGQKAFIKKDDKVLIVRSPGGELDFPGGKIQEEEEDLIESLKREVREETGLEIEVFKPFVVWDKTMPDHHKYAGKRIYLVGFRCEYVSEEVKLSDEHSTYKWVSEDIIDEIEGESDYFNALVA